MIRVTIACGAITTLAGVAGLLIREYAGNKGFLEKLNLFNFWKINSDNPLSVYVLYVSPILIISGVFILVAAVLKLALAEPHIVFVKRAVVDEICNYPKN